MIEFFKENVKLTLEKELLQRIMDDLAADKDKLVIVGAKYTLTRGIEKKTRGT